ncbi:MAG: hypothetical protein U5K84_10755 [Alkalibacterium sp.]|nr:hypothetical protein [Alkalibacterium sp.]
MENSFLYATTGNPEIIDIHYIPVDETDSVCHDLRCHQSGKKCRKSFRGWMVSRVDGDTWSERTCIQSITGTRLTADRTVANDGDASGIMAIDLDMETIQLNVLTPS